MAPTSKKTSKSVAFTTDEADTALLKEIEALLAQGEYSNFSDLCKDALEQFLFGEAPAVSGDGAAADGLFAQLQGQVGEVLAQLQNQATSIDALAAGTSDSSIDSQISQIVKQVKQVDTRTAQTLKQLQQQITDLDEKLGSVSGAGVESNIDEQLTTVIEKIERVEARTIKVFKELQKSTTATSSAGEVDTEAFEEAIARHIKTLTDRIGTIETKHDEQFKQLQQKLVGVEESASSREEQYLAQLQDQFSQFIEQLTPPELEEEDDDDDSTQWSMPEQKSYETPKPAMPATDDPLLSRLSLLVEDF